MADPAATSQQPLREGWSIALDQDNKGREEHWYLNKPAADLHPAPVPGSIQQVFPSQYGVAWYWHTFRPDRHRDPKERVLLRFQAVEYVGDVWLNGRHLGSHEGGEAPFVLDSTDALLPAENLLAVRVVNPTHTPIDGIVLNEIPHRNKMLASEFRPGNGLNYGGIVQPVELLTVPAIRVSDLVLRPDMTTGRIDAGITLRNDSAESARVTMQLDAGPANEGVVLASTTITMDLAPGEVSCPARLDIPHQRLWSLDDPYLYRVTALLDATGTSGAIYKHQHAARCGFRDGRVVNGYFRLNGKRIFLRSTHTGNHFPLGSVVPDDHDLVRRDLIFAKAAGFNMVRFIAGMALAEQLDFCDEIGLMVYEENLAAWKLGDSPHMAERFDRALREMILRDRNHPSIVIWGLLNETPDGPVFRHAITTLPLLRDLDPSRMVLLSSGRWDRDLTIGSVSNPYSQVWEPVWGNEGTTGTPAGESRIPQDAGQPAYVAGAGDVHVYPHVPHSDETIAFLRSLGQGTKPVYLSEYGIGSLLDVDHAVKRYQQTSVPPAADDLRVLRGMLDRLYADWDSYGLGRVFPFPRDLLRESQRLHARWRLFGLNLIRSNPQLAGYNVTGMLDHAFSGEGVWTFWREWKPGIVDALEDGFAPLRWCLFVTPGHGYAGRDTTVEAVLANEDVLAPGEYPTQLRIFGPAGPVWEQRVVARIPPSPEGTEGPLAVPVFKGQIRLDRQAGTYVLAAQMEQGGSPAGGRLSFYLSEPVTPLQSRTQLLLCGIKQQEAAWLAGHGYVCRPWREAATDDRGVILVGDGQDMELHLDDWIELAQRIIVGAVAVFLSPLVFRRDNDPLGWLPLASKGRCHSFSNWVYHREDIAMPHPIFDGLPARGIMDWDYYGPIIPDLVFEGQEKPDDIAAMWLTTGYASMTEKVTSGYASGLLTASYPLGAGRFLINSLQILENIDHHPAADRLLLNMIAHATRLSERPPTPAPFTLDEILMAIGYRS